MCAEKQKIDIIRGARAGREELFNRRNAEIRSAFFLSGDMPDGDAGFRKNLFGAEILKPFGELFVGESCGR